MTVKDKATSAKKGVRHVLEDRNAGRSCGDRLEGDVACFNLVHGVAVCNTDADAVRDGVAVEYTGLLTSIMVTCSRIKFPWCGVIGIIGCKGAKSIRRGDGGWT